MEYSQFLPDGLLLAKKESILAKYKLADGEVSPIWTCDSLQDISTFCADENGLIYATTDESLPTVIYIVSPEGIFLLVICNYNISWRTDFLQFCFT